MRASRSIAALLLSLALTGCGQKGALYLPDRSAPQTQQQPADPPADDDSKKKDAAGGKRDGGR